MKNQSMMDQNSFCRSGVALEARPRYCGSRLTREHGNRRCARHRGRSRARPVAHALRPPEPDGPDHRWHARARAGTRATSRARRGARRDLRPRLRHTRPRARDPLRAGAAVLALTCDVSDRHQVAELIRSVHNGFGPIDVLINNAGMVDVGPVGAMTAADFERDMATNFWGPLNVILAVLPHMRPRGEGRIVNIASIGGKVSVPHLLPYSSSKFALVGLSEGLRAELRASGILVTTVCPGLMRTGSPRHATFKGRHDAEYTWFSLADNLPLLSMDVERAARRILNAVRHGNSHVVLSLPAKVADKVHGLFPGLTSDALGLANRLLPGMESHENGVEGQHCRPGRLGAVARRAQRPGSGTAQPDRLRDTGPAGTPTGNLLITKRGPALRRPSVFLLCSA